MVRLMLTLTPIVCVCGGILVSEILSTYLNLRGPVPSTTEDLAKITTVANSSKKGKSSAPQGTFGPYSIFLI